MIYRKDWPQTQQDQQTPAQTSNNLPAWIATTQYYSGNGNGSGARPVYTATTQYSPTPSGNPPTYDSVYPYRKRFSVGR
jgi:hypothetical protein